MEDQENETYNKFIDLDTKNEQDAYLQSFIECRPIARKRRKLDEEITSKPKSYSFVYSVSTSTGKVQVCKREFFRSMEYPLNVSKDSVNYSLKANHQRT